MPVTFCSCGREFSRTQHCDQHIKANVCAKTRPDGTRHPKFASPRKQRDKLMKDISNALDEEDNLRKEKEMNGIFEFVDDAGPPSKRIRVGTLPKRNSPNAAIAEPDNNFLSECFSEDDSECFEENGFDAFDCQLHLDKDTLEFKRCFLDLKTDKFEWNKSNLELHNQTVNLDMGTVNESITKKGKHKE